MDERVYEEVELLVLLSGIRLRSCAEYQDIDGVILRRRQNALARIPYALNVLARGRALLPGACHGVRQHPLRGLLLVPHWRTAIDRPSRPCYNPNNTPDADNHGKGEMLFEPWRIEMFGGLVGRQRDREIGRFRTRKAADLLAYLAVYPNSAHSREELVEILWPDSDPPSGRHSLRQALTSLRRQFEPPGTPAGAVFIADRAILRVNPATVTTDVAEFEALLRSVSPNASLSEQAASLTAADRLYRGELLAGSYSEWLFPERNRLAEAHRSVLVKLIALYERLGDTTRGLDCALRAIASDSISEEAHCAAIRLYLAQGQPGEALRQAQDLERALWDELQARPSADACRLIDSLGNRQSRTARATLITHTSQPRKASSPPLSPAGPVAIALPLSFTRFFGRREELDHLHVLLIESGSRLTTLTGPGGCGKTRLALEVIRQLAESFEGAIAFVALAELEDAALIPAAILHALQIPRNPALSAVEQAERALSQRPFLLILDNFERLVIEGAPIVRSLLTAVPTLVCLATSRKPLDLEGEQNYPVGPLPLPAHPGSPERLMEFASIELFVDRAQRILPDFQVTPRNAADISAVCRKLEGSPLAIELAAARAHVVTPGQMLAQLDDRFAFLVSRRQEMPERHRTLRGAIDWSYQLLPPELRECFASLAVFRGGFTLEAASHVCSRSAMLDDLQQLCEQSFVLAEKTEEGRRYGLLESLREYAWERLAETDAEARQHAHASYFAGLAHRGAALLRGPQRKSYLASLEREHDNLRAALAWSLTAQPDLALELAGSLAPFWLARNHGTEGRKWLDRALQACPGTPSNRAQALVGAAWLAANTWDPAAARALGEAALLLYRDLGDCWGESFALIALGIAAHGANDHAQANQCLEAGLARARAAGDPWLVGHALLNAGRINMEQGDKKQALPLLEQCLRLFRETGDKAATADTLRVLAHTVQSQGQYERAHAMLDEARYLFDEIGDAVGVAHSVLSMGHIARFQEDFAAARQQYELGLSLCRPLGDLFGQAHALLNLGHLERSAGEFAIAHGRYAEALGLFDRLRDDRGIAFSLEGLAGAWAARGRPERAARIRAAADRLRHATGLLLPDLDRKMYDHYIRAVEETLGESAFRAASLEGVTMPLPDIIREALSEN